MSSATLTDYTAVFAPLARFLGWKMKEPRPSLDVETVITAAYHRIDEQDQQLKLQEVRLRLRDVEIELLKSDVEWLASVIKKSKVVLPTYDYVRLRQTTIKVRSMRSM